MPAATRTRWPRSSRSSTTRRRCRYRPRSSGPASLAEAEGLVEALEQRRDGPVEIRHARRGDKRRIYELAERNARLALEQDKLRSQRRRQQRVDALNELREAARRGVAAGADRMLRRLESRLHAPGRVDGRVRGRRAEEVRLPPLQGPRAERAPGRLRRDGGGPGAAHGAVPGAEGALASRLGTRRQLRGAARPDRDRRRPRPALERAAGRWSAFAKRASTVVGLAKRLEEVFVPGRRRPIVLPRRLGRAPAAPAAARRGAPLRRSSTTGSGATAR